jgi:hypothetical protein
MADDVFKEAPLRRDFADDAGNGGPEVAGIVFALAVACERERLAGITGRDDMNASAPRSAVKGSHIVPNRSRAQGRVCHPRHESGRGETVSFDITHSTVSGLCEMYAEIEASDAGAKAEAAKIFISVGGMNSHTSSPFQRGLAAAGVGSSTASGY